MAPTGGLDPNGRPTVSLQNRAAGIATQLLVIVAVVSVVFAALSAVVVAAVA
jgi:hypothetical protein